MKRDKRWIIDSGATCHCTGDIRNFETLDQRYKGRLGTASKSTKIMGKGIAHISLKNGSYARLRDVLYVPGMISNLLSTKLLKADGIFNCDEEDGYQFYRKDRRTLATGYDVGRTSYLGWVRSQDALLTKSFDSEKEFAYMARNDELDCGLLHQRFGHPGNRRLRRLVKKLGLELPADFNSMCEVCIQAKSVKRQNRGFVPRETKPLRRVYIDFWGPYKGKYYLSIVDDATGFSWIFILDNRRTETVIEVLEKWMVREERALATLLVDIRLDNAREFVGLKPWAAKKGIDLEFTEPYTPPQNGRAERLNRTLLEIARSLMLALNIPKRYWKYAVKMANFISNRTAFNFRDENGRMKSPYEAIYGRSYDLAKLRVPFCKVWFHVKTDDKLDPRAEEGVFVGYTKSSCQYVILDRQGRERKVTNPIFMEDEPGFISREAGERDLADIFNCLLNGNNIHNHASTGAGENDAGIEDSVAIGAGSTISGSRGDKTLGTENDSPRPSNSGSQTTNSSPATTNPSPVITNSLPVIINPSPAPESSNTTLRRSGRIRQPTQDLIESQQTERIYGRKSRQERRREEREASMDHSSQAARI